MLRYLSAFSSGTTGRPCTWSGVGDCAAADAGCADAWAATAGGRNEQRAGQHQGGGGREHATGGQHGYREYIRWSVRGSGLEGVEIPRVRILDPLPKTAHTSHVTRPGRVRSLLTFVFAAVSLAAFAVPVAAKSYSADRFDVTARLLPDRSLTVEERLVFRFEGGDYTYVFREIPKNRTDGVRDVEAGMDGVPFRVGDGPGSIELKEGRSVRVTWRFAPTSGIHIFTLRYRMAGVLTLDGVENVLAWQVLPGKHEYRIGYARAVVQLPPGVRLVGPPTVRPAEAEVSVRYAPDGQTPAADRGRRTEPRAGRFDRAQGAPLA